MKKYGVKEKVLILTGLFVFLLSFLLDCKVAAATPPSNPGNESITFLHHSTGNGVYRAKENPAASDDPATWGSNNIPLQMENYNAEHSTDYAITDSTPNPDIDDYLVYFPGDSQYTFLHSIPATYNQYPDWNYGSGAYGGAYDGYRRGWSNYPFDYYDLWVRHTFNGVHRDLQCDNTYLGQRSIEYLAANYDVVIFKHCFPGAKLWGDVDTNGDGVINDADGNIDGSNAEKRQQDYRLQYAALKEKMHQFPNTKFIVWTLATMTSRTAYYPNNPDGISDASAVLGRKFVNWVKRSTYEYGPANDPTLGWDDPDDNIYIFNFYDIETGDEVDGHNVPSTTNMFMNPLYAVIPYGIPSGDCHPNTYFANVVAAPAFLNRIIEVLQANHAPYAIPNQSAVTSANTPVNITLSATDAEADALTYNIADAPDHGTLTGSGANRTYTPSLNYIGTDSFTFTADDGLINSNVATVSITVTAPVNHAPVAQNQSATTNEDTPIAITLTATDADGNPLTYSIVTSPAHGTLTGSGANRTYTPSANYYGSDSFTFKANDGALDSNVATVSITVVSDDAIDFSDYTVGSYASGQDGSSTVTVSPDGSALSITGNGWKAIDFNYLITANTVMEFDFQSSVQGEIHAIGFDDDLLMDENPFKAFQLYGTQTWGLQNYRNYTSTDGLKHYSIPVGQFYTGQMTHLFFVMDHDYGATGVSVFSNVRVHDALPPGVIDFSSYTIESYVSGQDVSSTVTVSPDGSSLSIAGNGWKQIGFDYTITANTVLEFDFQSSVQGEIHAIGFDDDLIMDENPFKAFQLYGIQPWGLSNYKNYASGAPAVKHYVIPVGQFYTGQMTHLFFVMDHDVTTPNGVSVFSNVRVYEASTNATPIAQWNLDGNLSDSAGSHTGTITGTAVWELGKVGQALVMDQTSYVTVPDADDLDNTNKLAVACWVNPSLLDGNARGVVSKREDINSIAYSMFFYTGNKMYFYVNGYGDMFFADTTFVANTWYHVAMVYDGTLPQAERVKVYIHDANGALLETKTAAETSASIPNVGSNLYLGTLNSGYATKFQGKLDEVRIYRSALGAEEVQNLVE